MDFVLLPGYDRQEEMKELFTEYTQSLVEGDEEFGHYLKVQNFDYELSHLLEKYGPPRGRLYLAYQGEALAGCAALKEMDGERCELKRVYVRPAFRGQGLGKVLTQRIIDDAREVGYRHMLLDTFPFLERAIAMYRKLGFYEIPRYNDSPMTRAVYLELDL